MLKQKKRPLFRIILLLLLALAAGSAFYIHQDWQRQQQQLAALQLTLSDSVRLRIPRGTSLTGIAKLAAVDMPVDAAMFRALAHRQNIATSLQAGVYDFTRGQNMSEVLQALADGKVAVERITLIEGRTFADWRRQLAADTRLVQRIPQMSAREILLTLGIEHANLEGLFLPDTYFFQPGDSDLMILRRAHKQLKKTLAEHWENRAADNVFKTPYEALILASIVEKETGVAKERPLIASVFSNRLRVGMRLQADPTVIYGLGDDFDGNLTRAHLRKQDTPYNTYMRAGLPPTPIAISSAAAIAAVFNPSKSNYYYFVATGDGEHYFSKNLREHNNAVNRYQRKRRT